MNPGRQTAPSPTIPQTERADHDESARAWVAGGVTALRTSVDASHSPRAPRVHEFDLARPHQPHRGGVDPAAAEHVSAQQHLALAALEPRDVELRGHRLHSGRPQPCDPAGGDEQLPSADSRFQPYHGRLPSSAVEADDQVLNRAEPVAARIEQRASDDRQVHGHVRHGRLPPGGPGRLGFGRIAGCLVRGESSAIGGDRERLASCPRATRSLSDPGRCQLMNSR
jgi:hypothetical protein